MARLFSHALFALVLLLILALVGTACLVTRAEGIQGMWKARDAQTWMFAK